jgi:hypothetical protein
MSMMLSLETYVYVRLVDVYVRLVNMCMDDAYGNET